MGHQVLQGGGGKQGDLMPGLYALEHARTARRSPRPALPTGRRLVGVSGRCLHHVPAGAHTPRLASHELRVPSGQRPGTPWQNPWITEHTPELLSQARTAEATRSSEAKQKRNQAKGSARKDRIKWIHDQLVADPGPPLANS